MERVCQELKVGRMIQPGNFVSVRDLFENTHCHLGILEIDHNFFRKLGPTYLNMMVNLNRDNQALNNNDEVSPADMLLNIICS